MRVLITGTNSGIGYSTALKFLDSDNEVYGIDWSDRQSINQDNYYHYRTDIRIYDELPILPDIDIIINNAGTQKCDDIGVNLIGTMNICNRYAYHDGIKSVVNVASTSAHTGAEFPEYAASKGGVLAYTKSLANDLAKYGATVNSISPGGVLTELNEHVINDEKLWSDIMNLTPLKKWADPEEIAEWIYFMSVINKSMTGQDIIVDNGEMVRSDFIW